MSKFIVKHVKILQEIKAHSSDVTCVEFWGTNLLITGSSDKTVRVWRWNDDGNGFTEEIYSPLLGHRYGVTSVRVSPQGAVLASSSVDGTVILWELSDGSKTNTLSQENGESVRACTFSPDGRTIASSDDSGTVCVWGQNKTIKRLIRCHEDAVHVVAFSPDSNILLTACTLGNIRLNTIDIDMIDNENYIVGALDADLSIDAAHDLGVLSADFCQLIHTDPSDSNTTIYTVATCGTDHFIKLWRFYALRDITNLEQSRSRLVSTTPHEHISGTSTIYCTKKMNAECVMTISAHGSSVTCIRFNLPGTLLVSVSLDKTIKLWDVQGQCLKTLSEHSRYVNCVAINNDSSMMATGSNDKTIIIWDLIGTFNLDSIISNGTGAPRSLLYNLASCKIDIPLEFICPITHEIMKNPSTAEDGFTYEHSAITEWFDKGKRTSPMTNVELPSTDLMDNHDLHDRIDTFLKSIDFDTFQVTPDLIN